MQVYLNRERLRGMALALAMVSIIVSLFVLYLKLYFWGGMTYAPTYVWLSSWYLMAAGPLSLWLHKKRPIAALIIVALQGGIIWLASI